MTKSKKEEVTTKTIQSDHPIIKHFKECSIGIQCDYYREIWKGEEISRNFIPGIWKDMFRRTQFTDKEIDWVVEHTEIWFKRLSENQKKAFDWDVFDGPEKSTWYLFHAVYFIGNPGEFCQKLEAAQNRRLKRRDKAKIQYLIKNMKQFMKTKLFLELFYDTPDWFQTEDGFISAYTSFRFGPKDKKVSPRKTDPNYMFYHTYQKYSFMEGELSVEQRAFADRVLASIEYVGVYDNCEEGTIVWEYYVCDIPSPWWTPIFEELCLDFSEPTAEIILEYTTCKSLIDVRSILWRLNVDDIGIKNDQRSLQKLVEIGCFSYKFGEDLSSSQFLLKLIEHTAFFFATIHVKNLEVDNFHVFSRLLEG